METQKTSTSNIKRERFIRIAEGRVNRILENLTYLSKCSNKNNYEYSEADVRRIFTEIDRKVKEVKIQFQSKGESRKRFRL